MTERHHYLDVTPARFSEPAPDEVVVEEPPSRRWLWLKLIAALIAAIIAWNLLSAYETWRIYAGIVAAFWFFALGIHPIQAAGNTIRDWFDND